MDLLASDWDVTDEGPMEDLLGIEVQYNKDGSIKLHQTKYIEKLVEKFLPGGPLPTRQTDNACYMRVTWDFQKNMDFAPTCAHNACNGRVIAFELHACHALTTHVVS